MTPSLGVRLVMAGATSIVLTVTAILALHAASAVLAVAAIAAVTVLLGWFGHSASTSEHSGLAEVNAAWALPLALAGRARFGELLPLLVVQVAAAIAAGFGAAALGTRLGEPLLFDAPTPWNVALITALVGLLTAWTVLAVDGQAPGALLAAPVAAAGAAPSIALVAATNPAVTLGAAAAGLLSWPTAVAAAAGLLAVTALGAFAIAAVAPDTES